MAQGHHANLLNAGGDQWLAQALHHHVLPFGFGLVKWLVELALLGRPLLLQSRYPLTLSRLLFRVTLRQLNHLPLMLADLRRRCLPAAVLQHHQDHHSTTRLLDQASPVVGIR